VAQSNRPVSLGELAESLGVVRSSADWLAHTLRRRGFLSCPPGRREYTLGSSIRTLARQYDWNRILVKLAQPQLRFLAIQTNETAHLAVRKSKSAIFIDSIYTRHVVRASG
jgi:IclR family pca regulon transcriptional regulator